MIEKEKSTSKTDTNLPDASLLRIQADFNHDGGRTDLAHVREKESPFVIVLPAKGERWSLPDGSDAREPGSFHLHWNAPLPAGTALCLTLRQAAPAQAQIFRREGARWVALPLSAEGQATMTGLHAAGETLGIVSLRFPHPADAGKPAWNGHFQLDIALRHDGKTLAQEILALRTAPFLMASSLDPVTDLFVVHNRLTAAFVETLRKLASERKVRLQTVTQDDDHTDIWMQDTIEIGSAVAPAAKGIAHTLAVLPGMRARHDGIETATLDKNARAALEKQGAQIACDPEPRPHTRWIDWYGNLEVSPPVKTKAGRAFPLGRVLTGKQKELLMHPAILAFLEAQGVQTPPVVVDTSWLTIGHVDEVVNFVPARDRQGFRILLPSTALALTLLEQAEAHGMGSAAVFAGKKEQTTVKALRERAARSEENRQIQAALHATRAQLRDELGVEDADFIELPCLFEEGIAVIPNGVNGLVCNGHYLVPDPCGPKVGGIDPWAEAIRTPLEGLGVTVHFVDIWEPYHKFAGEIHCGTNAIRRPRHADWWKPRK